jgi:hypothetical protein
MPSSSAAARLRSCRRNLRLESVWIRHTHPRYQGDFFKPAHPAIGRGGANVPPHPNANPQLDNALFGFRREGASASPKSMELDTSPPPLARPNFSDAPRGHSNLREDCRAS